MKKHFKFWLIYSISGLIATGAGLSLFGEALAIKISGAETSTWFWWGTAALVIFNSGISLIGNGVKHRVHYEREKRDIG
jgi:uncharacterized membrane protein